MEREKEKNILSGKKKCTTFAATCYPASHKNSALRVSFLFLYTYGNK